jgi:hypothetical protein
MIQDKFYYYKTGVISKEEFLHGKGSLKQKKAVDTLDTEFQNWVNGKMDDHDEVVQSCKNAVLDFQRQQKEAREMYTKILLEEADKRQEAGFQYTPTVGYTPEQIETMLRDRNPGAPGARWLGDETFEHAKELWTKHMTGQSPGFLEKNAEGKYVDPNGVSQKELQAFNALLTDKANSPAIATDNIDPAVFGGQTR